MKLFLKLPFVIRALVLWGGVLFGIAVGLYFSLSDTGRNDNPVQLVGTASGHIIANRSAAVVPLARFTP